MTCPYVDSNYTILLQDFYCRLPFEERSKQVIRYLGSWSWYDKSLFFQIGMIIGDTEEHNKICGFRGGNGLY